MMHLHNPINEDVKMSNFIIEKFGNDFIWVKVRKLISKLNANGIKTIDGIETLSQPFGVLGHEKRFLLSSRFLKICKKNDVKTWKKLASSVKGSECEYAKFCFMKTQVDIDDGTIKDLYICWTFTQHPDGYFSYVIVDKDEIDDVSDEMNSYLKLARIASFCANTLVYGIIPAVILAVFSYMICTAIDKNEKAVMLDRYQQLTNQVK